MLTAHLHYLMKEVFFRVESCTLFHSSFSWTIYVNHLSFFFNFSCMLMTLVHPIHKKNIYELIKRLCIKMIKINHWFVANRLIINQSKTEFMVFHRNNKIIPTVIPSICINSSYINKVYSFKFFGVMLTEIWKSRNMLLMLLKRCQSSSPWSSAL